MITVVQMFGTQAGTGPGMGTVSVPVVFTANPNNDNQIGGGASDNNLIVPIKRFDYPGYIDIVFQVAPSNGGVTEYKVFESVDNNTLTNWSSYRMELGFGYGTSFISSPSGDGLDFDDPDYNTPPVSSVFTNVATSEDVLVFSNGIHSTGSETYLFRIDVPDLSDTGATTSFTLRQVPIPEPSSYLLFLCALTCLWIYRKHRS